MKTHGPIESQHHGQMNVLAKTLDEIFNGEARGSDRKIGFALLVYEFGKEGRLNYIGNGKRANMLCALKELVARWEGRMMEEDDAGIQ